MLRAFPVRQFRVEQAVDGVDLAGRGPAGEFVDARLRVSNCLCMGSSD